MVRAAGQGHGRNDAATTDPQPRSRCSSYAHDAMSVTRVLVAVGVADATRECFRYVFSRGGGGVWMFVLVRVVGVRGYDGRILDADRCEKWRPRCTDKQGKRRLDVSTCCIFLRGCRARSHARLFRRFDAEVWSAR